MKSTLVGVLLAVGPSVLVACGGGAAEGAGLESEGSSPAAADAPVGSLTTPSGEPTSDAVRPGPVNSGATGGAAPSAGAGVVNSSSGPDGTSPAAGPSPTEPGPGSGTASDDGSPSGGELPANPIDGPEQADSDGVDEPLGETDADAAAGGTDESPPSVEPPSPEPPSPEPIDAPGEPNTGDCVPAHPAASVVVGYGANTTGGGGAAPVVVSSFSEAEAALAAYRSAFKDGTQRALVIRYAGTFDFSTITDVCRQHTLESRILQIKEMENVTFEGAPGSSANFGLKINRAKNVIVRNMTIGLLPGGGDSDAITIEGNGSNGDVEHVWIDHNELFSSTKDDCDGAGDTEFDGLIDIKKGARYITISYNHIHDHQKTGLIGHSDSDDMERYITFHHNWYDNVVSRTPLHRFGYVHLFNNYYNRILSSGINVRMGGVALIEANYFEHAMNPVTSRYSDEPGYWDLRDNYVGEGITWSSQSDTLANADDWQSTTTFPEHELSYAYTPDAARCVKQIVMAEAGATLAP